jgi:hypothetical protein
VNSSNPTVPTYTFTFPNVLFKSDDVYVKVVITIAVAHQVDPPNWLGDLQVNGTLVQQIRTFTVDNQRYNVTYRLTLNRSAVIAAGGTWKRATDADPNNVISIVYTGFPDKPGGPKAQLVWDTDASNYLHVFG